MMNFTYRLATSPVCKLPFFLCRLALVLGLGLRSVFILAICCRPSVCLSVCRLSVTLVPLLSRLKFSAMLLRHLLSWIRLHQRNILRRSSQGNPSVGGRGAAVTSKAISRKRCKTGGKLVLITNRKSNNYELSIGTKINDLD